MSLQAIKLTKENLPTIARTLAINPEALSLLASYRDRYVLFETHALGRDTYRIWSETHFHREFKFVEPEANRFIDIVTK